MATVQAGDHVRVVNIPDWLLRDLSEEERARLKGQRNKVVTVLELMPSGYLWLSFADGTQGFSLKPSDVELVAA